MNETKNQSWSNKDDVRLVRFPVEIVLHDCILHVVVLFFQPIEISVDPISNDTLATTIQTAKTLLLGQHTHIEPSSNKMQFKRWNSCKLTI